MTQLQECINSGQVSAAQVVAHAEAGELPELPSAHRAYQVDSTMRYVMDDYYSADQMREYATVALAAKQEEVVRLREAAEAVLSNEEHAFSGGMRNYQKGSQTWQVYEDLRIALTAPGEKHE